jgi:uncharacterized protein (TIGR04255 family)
MASGSAQAAITLPKYKNPPVVEVVIGVTFAPIEKLSSVHFGSFWEAIKNEYPKSEDNFPLMDESPANQVEVLQMPPLRRVFLVHTDGTYLMQLQPDKFIHNWRKTKDSDQYPNFEAAKDKFDHGWALFCGFLDERGLGKPLLRRYEVTYINHIVGKSGTFPVGAEEYLPVFGWKNARFEKFLPDPQVFGLDLRFTMPSDKGTLRANVKHGKRKTDDADVLLMELTAQGPAKADGSDIESWLDLAHQWIVRGFTDLTSKDAHERWGRYQ